MALSSLAWFLCRHSPGSYPFRQFFGGLSVGTQESIREAMSFIAPNASRLAILFFFLLVTFVVADLVREARLRRLSAKVEMDEFLPGAVFFFIVNTPSGFENPGEFWLVRFTDFYEARLRSWNYVRVARCSVEVESPEFPNHLVVSAILPIDSALLDSGFFWKTGRAPKCHTYAVALLDADQELLWPLPPPDDWLV
jgi:hypothetical protein